MEISKILMLRETAALRPRLACEVMPAGVVAARRAADQEISSAFVPLRSGAFSPSLKAPNFLDLSAISGAIRKAVDEVSERESKLTLVVPDAAVRVLLLDFDSLPAKPAESLPIVRFRLRKLVPFETEDAPVSYQVISSKDGVVRAIVAVSPKSVVAEYESAVREAGYEPSVILPSTLAALAAVNVNEASLVVNQSAHSVTTAITQQDELLLYRTLELGDRTDGLPSPDGNFARFDGAGVGASALEELQQSVSVAVAYFEDTLAAPPRQLLACGWGGAEELLQLLGDSSIPARDLVPTPATGNATSIPRGVLAGVLGALAS